MVVNTMLHYATLRYATYTTLHYITLCYTTLHDMIHGTCDMHIHVRHT